MPDSCQDETIGIVMHIRLWRGSLGMTALTACRLDSRHTICHVMTSQACRKTHLSGRWLPSALQPRRTDCSCATR